MSEISVLVILRHRQHFWASENLVNFPVSVHMHAATLPGMKTSTESTQLHWLLAIASTQNNNSNESQTNIT